jgi:hypothetical protein
MATLRECRTAHQVKQALKSLPETLDQTYDRILQKIPGKDMDYAKAALIWLACSERPLSLEELAEAIIVQPFVKTIDPEDRLSDPLEVLEICGSLVSLSQVEGRYSDGRYALGLRFRTVQLSHYSVKEYLMSERMRSKKETAMYVHAFHKAQQILAETCITYLLLDDIEVDTEFDYLIKLYPLLGYSAYY